jgi:hypothetical protein
VTGLKTEDNVQALPQLQALDRQPFSAFCKPTSLIIRA